MSESKSESQGRTSSRADGRAPTRVPMLMLPPEVAIQGFEEELPGYSRQEATAEARRADDHDFGAARGGCPFRVDVDALVRSVAEGDFDAALGVVMQAHPWAGILGRHCHRYCERADAPMDGVESINISALERAAGDYGNGALFPFRPGRATGKQVAIIGTGSAASAVAYRLRQLGHRVGMYEQLPVSGGMMFVGYPNFRLPLSVLRRENTLEEWGVETHYNTWVDRELLERLLSEYDAVVIGTGKFREVWAGIPGEDLEGVWDALHFLGQVKLGTPPPIGPRVVVLGAGFSAQDAARTCVRLGHEVHVLYRRGQDDMPIFPHLRARFAARMAAEGAPFRFYTAPVRILGKGGRVVGIECVRTEPGPPDETGRPSPRPIEGSQFVVACDAVIEATGETVDLSFLPAEANLKDAEHIAVDESTWATSVPKLFACGEVTGLATTGMAFWSGFSAAQAVDALVRGASVRSG
jgi:NADPH-dependent glutamate synthase beta subunit-like oxidoreductase